MDITTELAYLKMLKEVFSEQVKLQGYDAALEHMEGFMHWTGYAEEVMQWYDLDGAGGVK